MRFLLALLLLSAPASAQTANRPILAELFTSQGCSSCPPAEALFARLADDPRFVTIEWHVDYWDQLIHHGTSWKDPYSNPAFTARQRNYNAALLRSRRAYTPQAVIQGQRETVGNNPRKVEAAINQVAPASAEVSAVRHGAGWRVRVRGAGWGGVYLVLLLDRHETAVTGGENRGRTLHGRNLALGMIQVGDWRGGEAVFDVAAAPEAAGCAVFVQGTAEYGLGPILGAAYCE